MVKTSIQGSYIPVLPRNKPKEYLGHLLSIDGSGENEQLQNIDEFFKDNLKYISDSLLPVGAKIEAINTILMSKLRKFYLIFEQEIQIWPKVLVKKVTMQCTKMKNHTDACYPCKINKTGNFSPILVTSIHKTDSFRL